MVACRVISYTYALSAFLWRYQWQGLEDKAWHSFRQYSWRYDKLREDAICGFSFM